MKFTLVLLIVAAIIGCVLSCTKEDYDAYKIKFNKEYKTEEDNLTHMKIYCQSVRSVGEHNERFEQKLETYEKGINQFSDLTAEEMQGYFGYLG